MNYERQFHSECINVASTYTHFTAIAQLSTKLGDTLVMTEELLDTTLVKQRTNFQSVNNDKLQVCYMEYNEVIIQAKYIFQEVYQLLGKTQTAAD